MSDKYTRESGEKECLSCGRQCPNDCPMNRPSEDVAKMADAICRLVEPKINPDGKPDFVVSMTELFALITAHDEQVRAEAINDDFRMDELDAVMISVDKWFDKDDTRLKNNPATRAADAREIALKAIERVKAKERKACGLIDDGLLWQEIYSLREKLKIAVSAIKFYAPDFDDLEFTHRLNAVDYDQLMEEIAEEIAGGGMNEPRRPAMTPNERDERQFEIFESLFRQGICDASDFADYRASVEAPLKAEIEKMRAFTASLPENMKLALQAALRDDPDWRRLAVEALDKAEGRK
jgi:hypothetical protein